MQDVRLLDLVDFRRNLFVGYYGAAILFLVIRNTVVQRFVDRIVQLNVVVIDVHLFVDVVALELRVQSSIYVLFALLDHSLGRPLQIVGLASPGHEIDKRLGQIESVEFAGGVIEWEGMVIVVVA